MKERVAGWALEKGFQEIVARTRVSPNPWPSRWSCIANHCKPEPTQTKIDATATAPQLLQLFGAASDGARLPKFHAHNALSQFSPRFLQSQGKVARGFPLEAATWMHTATSSAMVNKSDMFFKGNMLNYVMEMTQRGPQRCWVAEAEHMKWIEYQDGLKNEIKRGATVTVRFDAEETSTRNQGPPNPYKGSVSWISRWKKTDPEETKDALVQFAGFFCIKTNCIRPPLVPTSCCLCATPQWSMYVQLTFWLTPPARDQPWATKPTPVTPRQGEPISA